MEKQDKSKDLFPDVEMPTDEETPIRGERKQLEHGTNAETAFVINDDRDTSDILAVVFGFNDGDYFIMGTGTKQINGKPYRIHLVEDKYGFRYNVWFDVTKASLLHGLSYKH